MKKIILIHLLCAIVFVNCGSNTFQLLDTPDPAEKATRQIEERKYDEAIDTLDDALKDDPDNYQLLSIKATAIAHKYGVDLISIGRKMADSESEDAEADTAAKSDVTSLFSVLPDATDENIDGLNEAIEIMDSIPDSEKTVSDNYKAAIYLTALTSMRVKKVDGDGDGKLTPEEILNMSIEDAIGMLSSLTSAIDVLGGAGVSNQEAAQKISENLGTIKDKIAEQEGATDDEKVKGYLESLSSSRS